MLRFFRKISPALFLSRQETRQLSERIEQFEKKTGCELVFHFRKYLGAQPVEANRKLFYKFKLNHTTGRRALLITLALNDRQFAVWADHGIAGFTGEKLWEQIAAGLGHDLRSGKRLLALLNAVNTAQTLLMGIPALAQAPHANEISNDPIIDESDDES